MRDGLEAQAGIDAFTPRVGQGLPYIVLMDMVRRELPVRPVALYRAQPRAGAHVRNVGRVTWSNYQVIMGKTIVPELLAIDETLTLFSTNRGAWRAYHALLPRVSTSAAGGYTATLFGQPVTFMSTVIRYLRRSGIR